MPRTHGDPISVKLPHDLDLAVRARAEAEGISLSELVRAALAQMVYGQIPSVDEGYLQAKNTAARLAHALIVQAVDSLPNDYESAVEMLIQLQTQLGR